MTSGNSSVANPLHNENSKIHSATSSANGNASIPSSIRAVSTSTLDSSKPLLSIQYKQKQKEKRRRIDSDQLDDASSDGEGNDHNYFLLAAQHELQNMEEEINTKKNILTVNNIHLDLL
jgi:hypothetical protein